MTNAELLKEMDALLHTRADLLRHIERAESAATAAGGMGDGMPRGTPKEPKLQRVCVELADLRAELANVEQELAIYRRKVAPEIGRIPAGSQRLMLRLRYLEWRTMAEVARRSGYAREYVYRAMRAAERCLGG